MKNSGHNDNQFFDTYAYLKGVVVDEVLDYMNRVACINDGQPEEAVSFFQAVEKEMKEVATNRKFMVLNTNVIVATYKRVLENDTLRKFYFELVSSIRTRIALELDHMNFGLMMGCFIKSLEVPVFTASDNSQSLVQTGNDMRQVAAELVHREAETKHFLSYNEWYYGIILCNFFAASILSEIQLLSETTKTVPK